VKHSFTYNIDAARASALIGNTPTAFNQTWHLRLVGLFVSEIKESMEMLYQSEFECLFDGSKFEKYFNIKPTPYWEGITASV